MKKIVKLTMAVALLCLTTKAWCQNQDDFGLWFESTVEKNLPYNLSVGITGEVRTQNNTSNIDRLTAGFSLGYKVNKYFKVGVSYNLMGMYNPNSRKEHFKTRDDGSQKLDSKGNPIWNGYKTTPSYWTPRHRLNIEATAGVKVGKWVRLSLRERYQFTRKASKTIDETKYRYDIDESIDPETGEPIFINYGLKDGYPIVEPDTKGGTSDHLLRSRFKAELDKKKLKWSPFVSVEFHNNLTSDYNDGNRRPVLYLKKIRSTFGTGYKFNKHHSISAAYVLTCNRDADYHKRIHAISLGYEYDF